MSTAASSALCAMIFPIEFVGSRDTHSVDSPGKPHQAE
jgi:hypothetical protein